MSIKEKALAKILCGTNDQSMNATDFFQGLRAAGWTQDRIKGSHHIWLSSMGATLPVPVHGSKIKPVYVRQARQIINEERN